ncbi:MAG: indolepyruvate ferredoxin oxidoreductase family protein, partial [Proteobacteria bacterium]|nr:indolepyruvate ferredoxin oxidoreductase family protein [Pseudomonadota bacterium]
LAEAVARSYFKLLAYKDEYEVARLFTDGAFMERLRDTFEGDFKLTFHLAPPLAAQRDPVTGVPKKRQYGPWMMTAFKVLARCKGLRGTPFDVFGRSGERRLERRLIADYEQTVEEFLRRLDTENHCLAVALAALPETVRGYGHVKERNVEKAKAREVELLEALRNPAPSKTAAE